MESTSENKMPLDQSSGLIFLIGGARSGKSSLAVELASAAERETIFVATARPNWLTVEEPLDLAHAISEAPSSSCIIIDCLTLWLSNLMLRGDSESAINTASTKTLAAIATRVGRTIAISNEVGLGIVPESELARNFREIIGRVNQQWARAARQSLFLVAGRALELQKPERLLR
ncbi:MAG: bifunctional adenosylcobinamide kinase/adenosylcobinamide-phosphate guanylyltransferase [Actinobacteria bacterium]|nr:bifunctional adenosylcobinamide kinase/adenosylcobinamide-phosphate guanylyltransferase [Actinomycetota bacterium]